MAVRYPITLSVSEPNNNIGLLKVRQADEESQTLVVQILEDAVPKSYKDLQVFFCARIGQTAGLGIIEQKLNPEEMTDPKNGKLEYTLRAEDWQVLGRQNAYFSFRKMTDDHTFVQQFSTRDFTYEVTKSIYSDGIKEVKKDGSTYVWTIEDLKRLYEEYIASGKSDWEEFVDQNKEIIESVDPGGKVLGELIDARKSSENGLFTTLSARLNSNDKLVSRKLYTFQNVSEMKKFDLKDGDFVQTHGFYSADDGGGAFYSIYIDGETDNGLDTFKLDNNLFAKITLTNNIIRPKQLGAIADGQTDDYSVFLHLINYYAKAEIRLDEDSDYYIGTRLYINSAMKIIGRDNKVYTNEGFLLDGHYHRKIILHDFWIINPNDLETKSSTGISFLDSSIGWGATVDFYRLKVKNFLIGIQGKSCYGAKILNCHVEECEVGYHIYGEGENICNQNTIEQNMAIKCKVGFLTNNTVGTSFHNNTCEADDYGIIIGSSSTDTTFEKTWFEHIGVAAITYGSYSTSSKTVSVDVIHNNKVTVRNSRFFKESGYTDDYINRASSNLLSKIIIPNSSKGVDRDYIKGLLSNGVEYKNFAGVESYVFDYSSGSYANNYSDTPFGRKKLFVASGLSGGWYTVITPTEPWIQKTGKVILVKLKIKVSKKTQIFGNVHYDNPTALKNTSIVESVSTGLDVNPGVWTDIAFLIKVKSSLSDGGASAHFRFNLWNHSGSIDYIITDPLFVDVTSIFGDYSPDVNMVDMLENHFAFVDSGQSTKTGGTQFIMPHGSSIPDYRSVSPYSTFYYLPAKKILMRLDDGWYDLNGVKV